MDNGVKHHRIKQSVNHKTMVCVRFTIKQKLRASTNSFKGYKSTKLTYNDYLSVKTIQWKWTEFNQSYVFYTLYENLV